MSENNKKDAEKTKDPLKDVPKEKIEQISIEQKLKETEDNLDSVKLKTRGEDLRKKKKTLLSLVIIILLKKA